MGYLYEQGLGQLSLLTSGRDNAEVLKDPKISEKVKSKIRSIEKAKKYFFEFWEREPGGIYSETTFLEDKAVTYLVVASAFDQIRPKVFHFPIMGSFPYIGYFKKSSAEKKAKKLEAKGYETMIRPVYAYSTLGYLEDNILSSFFQYSPEGLSELIFHELFHTIFFIKGEVKLNENLASYFAEELNSLYYNWDEKVMRDREIRKEKRRKLNRKTVELIQQLNQSFLKNPPLNKEETRKRREIFLTQKFNPQISKLCEDLEMLSCFPLLRKWNNASMAGYLTYQEKQDKIKSLRIQQNKSLKEFFHWINGRYKEYKKANYSKRSQFSEFLFSKQR